MQAFSLDDSLWPLQLKSSEKQPTRHRCTLRTCGQDQLVLLQGQAAKAGVSGPGVLARSRREERGEISSAAPRAAVQGRGGGQRHLEAKARPCKNQPGAGSSWSERPQFLGEGGPPHRPGGLCGLCVCTSDRLPGEACTTALRLRSKPRGFWRNPSGL